MRSFASFLAVMVGSFAVGLAILFTFLKKFILRRKIREMSVQTRVKRFYF